MKIIKTKKFILRPFKKSDEKLLPNLLNDKIFSRNIPSIPYPYKLKDAHEYMKRIWKEQRKKKPSRIDWVIEIGGDMAGSVSLVDIESEHRAEVGYWLAKKYWNRGVIPEALSVVTKFGFEKLKLKRIYAKVLSHNKASMRVLKKNNYKYEGIAKKDCKIDKKFIDNHFFAKVK